MSAQVPGHKGQGSKLLSCQISETIQEGKMSEGKQKNQETSDHLRNTFKNQMFGIQKKKVLMRMGV